MEVKRESDLQSNETDVKLESIRDKANNQIKCPKHRIKNLSLMEKYEVIEKFERGVKVIDIARELQCGKTQIYDTIKKKDKIKRNFAFASKNDKLKKKVRTSSSSLLNKLLFQWYKESKNYTQITGPKIQERALQLAQQLNMPDQFKASSGWLRNFKKQFNIRLSNSAQGDDEEGEEEFNYTDYTDPIPPAPEISTVPSNSSVFLPIKSESLDGYDSNDDYNIFEDTIEKNNRRQCGVETESPQITQNSCNDEINERDLFESFNKIEQFFLAKGNQEMLNDTLRLKAKYMQTTERETLECIEKIELLLAMKGLAELSKEATVLKHKFLNSQQSCTTSANQH